jgi:gliding motility-associatede transport system auxiliary component
MGVQNRSGKYFKFLVYVVVVVLINLVAVTLFFRKDLTENKIYSLSKVSKEVVSTLTEPLTIKVFFTKNLPSPHNNTERYLRDLMAEYAVHANKFFNYQFFDVSPESEGLAPSARENQELANSYGINPVQIQNLENDEMKFKRAYMGLVIIHGDIVEKIPTIGTTEGLEYNLTTAILKVNNKISSLLALSENIQVTFYMSSTLRAVAPLIGLEKIAHLSEDIDGIVKTLNLKNYDRLSYHYIDPATDASQTEASEKFNLMALKWPALADGEIAAGNGVIGLVMTHKDKSVSLPILRVFQMPLIGTQYQLAESNEIEEMLNGHVESILDINQRVGYLAGHGTLPLAVSMPSMGQLPNALKTFTQMLNRTYSPKQFVLSKDPVPEDVKCIVLVRPTESFSDYELFQIDQALMRGQNLAIFLEPFKEVQMPSMDPMTGRQNQRINFEPLDTGLEKLLSHYGVSVTRSIVLDENCFNQPVPQRMGGGQQPIYFAPIIKQEHINNELAFMKNIKELIALKASPIKIDKERLRENGLKSSLLFSTSEKSWEMKAPINLNPQFMSPPGPDSPTESKEIAYIIEGEFPSYFAGKPVPEKTDADAGKETDKKADTDTEKQSEGKKVTGEGIVLAKGKTAKLFLVGSGELIRDDLLDAAGRSPNAMFVLNMLDLLNDREGIATMRSKTQRMNPLKESSMFTKTAVKIFNIAGLPVLVVLFGLIVWTRRHVKKKSIQRMFDTD